MGELTELDRLIAKQCQGSEYVFRYFLSKLDKGTIGRAMRLTMLTDILVRAEYPWADMDLTDDIKKEIETEIGELI